MTGMASVRDLIDGTARDLHPTPPGWANPMHYRAPARDRQEEAA